MDRYSPPYEITANMLNLVASISEKLGQLNVCQRLAARPHLRRNNRIRSIHASLKIEANSMSLGEVRDVLAGKAVLGDAKEIQEVKNAYAAYEKIGTTNPFDMDALKSLHGIMTRYVLEDAGKFRSGEEGVFEGEKCIFMAPPASLVPSLMQDLFAWLAEAREELHPLILSAIFHYEFVFIHPFSDGNGRMARLWHTIILAKWHDVFEYIPLESQIEKCQAEYYSAIGKCHVAGNSNAFVEFMLCQIDAALQEVLPSLQQADDCGSEYVKKLLAAMEYGVPYSARKIMEKLGLKSRETFRKNYLHPALAMGLVERTLPDKPNSRNQRYVRK